MKINDLNEKYTNEGGIIGKINELEDEVKSLKDKIQEKTGDDGCCCGCCIGLAVGYVLFTPGIGDKIFGSVDSPKAVVARAEAQEDNFMLKHIRNYQLNISPSIKESMGVEKLCKFEPSCSEYARQAVERYGTVKGGAKAAARLARCNPLSKGGYDPLV